MPSFLPDAEFNPMDYQGSDFDPAMMDSEEPIPEIPAIEALPDPTEPEIAKLFALMEAGGDEELLTEEEQAQLAELMPEPGSGDFDQNLALDMDCLLYTSRCV